MKPDNMKLLYIKKVDGLYEVWEKKAVRLFRIFPKIVHVPYVTYFGLPEKIYRFHTLDGAKAGAKHEAKNQGHTIVWSMLHEKKD